jgi:hypothetical protein
VILISVWEGAQTRENVAAYCELWDIQGAVLLDESGAYARLLGIRGVPTNVLVKESGAVHAVGLSNPQALAVEIERLIGNRREASTGPASAGAQPR